MNKKLILLDIDGTIISYQNEAYIPKETLAAIHQLKQNGHSIAVATGRCFCFARTVMAKLNIEHAVLHNGAQVVLNGKSVYEKKIGARTSAKICSMLIDTPLCVFAFDGESVYTHNMSEESRKYIIAEALRSDIIKPLNESKSALFALSIYGELGRLVDCFTAIPSIDFKPSQAEITAKGVSKRSGLKRLARLLNIEQKDTIAVGDGLNDIDMIKAAGIGVAVGGACEELKAAADIVSDTIEQGGILKVFQELKLI